MILTRAMYVPAIRWRQGEYQALFRLAPAAKDRIVPYVTIPEIEFDFEEWRPKKTVQEHVHPFAARFNAKWGQRPAWIAVHPSIADQSMDDGRDILTYVFDALRAFRAMAVPAIPLDAIPAIVARVRAIAVVGCSAMPAQFRSPVAKLRRLSPSGSMARTPARPASPPQAAPSGWDAAQASMPPAGSAPMPFPTFEPEPTE